MCKLMRNHTWLSRGCAHLFWGTGAAPALDPTSPSTQRPVSAWQVASALRGERPCPSSPAVSPAVSGSLPPQASHCRPPGGSQFPEHTALLFSQTNCPFCLEPMSLHCRPADSLLGLSNLPRASW